MTNDTIFEQIPLVSTILLLIIKENPSISGYDILKKIPELIGEKYSIKTGTLYTQLRRLEKSGFLVSVQEAKGRRKRRYEITEEGIEELKMNTKKIRERVYDILIPLLKRIENSEP